MLKKLQKELRNVSITTINATKCYPGIERTIMKLTALK